MAASKGEAIFAALYEDLAKRYKWPVLQSEYRFAPPRKWRADFAEPGSKLLIEIEGGTWTRGRHTRGKGYIGDIEKYNMAALEGWTVIRFATSHVMEQPDYVEGVLKGVMRYWEQKGAK